VAAASLAVVPPELIPIAEASRRLQAHGCSLPANFVDTSDPAPNATQREPQWGGFVYWELLAIGMIDELVGVQTLL